MDTDTQHLDKYLISLARQTSLAPEIIAEIEGKLPRLSPYEKARLKLELIRYLLLDTQDDTLAEIPGDKAGDMTMKDLDDINQKVMTKALAKEDASVSTVDIQDIDETLKTIGSGSSGQACLRRQAGR